ncbi:MAG: hypothetical protein Q8L84_14335, partial [Hyphomonas sp.]|nr:hypothetical protein [Hyphomonas sp.]
MTDYYELPPPKKERSFAWLYLLLLLLFLLGIWATWWSLRLKPGEIGQDPMLSATALPAAPLARAEPPVPVALVEPAAEEAVLEVPVIEAVPEALPEAETPLPLFSDSRWRETARFTGTDGAGRSAQFTAYVLVGDETWTLAGSPYRGQRGWVREGATLSIEAGVSVCLEELVVGDTARVRALGQAGAPVRMSPLGGGAGWWRMQLDSGVLSATSLPASVMRHVEVENLVTFYNYDHPLLIEDSRFAVDALR